MSQIFEKQKAKLALKLDRERILERDLVPLASQIVGLLREHGSLGIAEIETLT